MNLNDLSQRLARRLSRWAWQSEINTVEGMAKLQQLHMTDGAMEMHIKQSPELAQWVAQCFAYLVADSPNYTEVKFDLVAKGSKFDWVTVLIQKGGGKTQHQLRREAEAELASLKAKYSMAKT